MGIKNIFIWYQQKIGTYDKQKWETKIEQREQRMYGLTHIQTRSTKPNTDLIDLDLVRGSSFTKAKPQHGFIKVVKLATLRSVFYPFYGKWWIEQTSIYVFLVILLVYITEVINMIIYTIQILPINNSVGSENLSLMEIFVPFIMMWVLSLTHSQIVATSSGLDSKKTKVKQRQYKRKKCNAKRIRKMDENIYNLKNLPNNENKATVFTTHVAKQKLGYGCKRFSARAQINKDLCDEEVETVNINASKINFEDIPNNPNGNRGNNITNQIIENPFGTFQVQKEQSTNTSNKQNICGTDSESEIESAVKRAKKPPLISRRNSHMPAINITSVVDSPYDSEDDIISSSENRLQCPLIEDISATEWMGVTTNSEDCSYSSDIENISESNLEAHENNCMVSDSDLAPTAILNPPPSLKVSCVIWERNEIKKADLSMLDISSAIIGKVDLMPESMDYFYIGIVISTILATLPFICRICNMSTDDTFSESRQILTELYRNVTITVTTSSGQHIMLNIYRDIIVQIPLTIAKALYSTFNINKWELTIMIVVLLQRWILSCMVFFLLCVAERTFKQRLLYAKLFSHLTSSRRARKSELPHFRLNKVRNIKTWLSVRSYLKKRGPQRSVDVIVSTAFIGNLLLLIFLCVELLKDTVLFSQYYLEALIWCLGLGTLLLRFMTLGTKINKKYRNLSVLITEQINLHLQIEQKPHKKDEFTVANNVLKLAIDLLKELENPFKISGISANPILYNVTKLVILSALSGVLSEMLGFKLKLHKIKLK